MRIGIDIDSTLHHYWDSFSGEVLERHGIHLPYEEQETWHIEGLSPEEVSEIVAATHSGAHVSDAVPYAGAVEAVNRWAQAGHFIHITSHRSTDSHEVTTAWLDSIGLQYDELYCSFDKISRCRELGIDLLVDDSPVNIERAIEEGMAAATILHPWNREVCARLPVASAEDWPGLETALEPYFSAAA
ncbi:MAG: hypothetical protein KGR19_01190 [Acidobacteria bacterium]|nr:hypothetical protein [Acidobacteriota bacterium]